MSGWRRFFDAYADRYDAELFTRGTEAEVRFLIEQVGLPEGGAVLDVGCGTGRHSVALARRGYRVTGVDISEAMLDVARRRAREAGLAADQITWVRTDALAFERPGAFDAVLCLCEGAMCLLGPDDDAVSRDMALLRHLAAALRPGGVLVLNVLSAARVLRAMDEAVVRDGRFDLATMTERSDVSGLLGEREGDEQVKVDVAGRLRERYYTGPEIRRMVEDAGLAVQGVYGGTAGNWGLRPIELDDYELMVIARRLAG